MVQLALLVLIESMKRLHGYGMQVFYRLDQYYDVYASLRGSSEADQDNY
jgi:hypothetical protein